MFGSKKDKKKKDKTAANTAGLATKNLPTDQSDSHPAITSLRPKICAALGVSEEMQTATINNEMEEWNSSGVHPDSEKRGHSPLESIEQRVLSGTEDGILRAVATLRWCVKNGGRREIFGDGSDETSTLLKIALGDQGTPSSSTSPTRNEGSIRIVSRPELGSWTEEMWITWTTQLGVSKYFTKLGRAKIILDGDVQPSASEGEVAIPQSIWKAIMAARDALVLDYVRAHPKISASDTLRCQNDCSWSWSEKSHWPFHTFRPLVCSLSCEIASLDDLSRKSTIHQLEASVSITFGQAASQVPPLLIFDEVKVTICTNDIDGDIFLDSYPKSYACFGEANHQLERRFSWDINGLLSAQISGPTPNASAGASLGGRVGYEATEGASYALKNTQVTNKPFFGKWQGTLPGNPDITSVLSGTTCCTELVWLNSHTLDPVPLSDAKKQAIKLAVKKRDIAEWSLFGMSSAKYGYRWSSRSSDPKKIYVAVEAKGVMPKDPKCVFHSRFLFLVDCSTEKISLVQECFRGNKDGRGWSLRWNTEGWKQAQ